MNKIYAYICLDSELHIIEINQMFSIGLSIEQMFALIDLEIVKLTSSDYEGSHNRQYSKKETTEFMTADSNFGEIRVCFDSMNNNLARKMIGGDFP